MSLLLFRPRYDRPRGSDIGYGPGAKKRRKKKEELIECPSQLVTLEDFAGDYLDLESPAFLKKLELLSEEEQGILLLLMLDDD